jgi:hypothetical protein
VKFQIVIRYDAATGNREVLGIGQDQVVELGMIWYAELKLRRLIAEAELVERMQNRPRVAVPGGPLG